MIRVVVNWHKWKRECTYMYLLRLNAIFRHLFHFTFESPTVTFKYDLKILLCMNFHNVHIQANVLCIWWVLCFAPSLSNWIINNQLNDDGKDAELSIVKKQKYCHTILKYQFLHYILSRFISDTKGILTDLLIYTIVKQLNQ